MSARTAVRGGSRRRALALAALLSGSCATATSSSTPRTPTQDLAAFTADLARAGMSVPLPPRICEEPARECTPRVDEEIGCIEISPGCPPERAVLISTYARAIVAHRLPADASARADELVAAWLQNSESFSLLAAKLEQEFDARRTATARPTVPARLHSPAPSSEVSSAGPGADAGPGASPSGSSTVPAPDAGLPAGPSSGDPAEVAPEVPSSEESAEVAEPSLDDIELFIEGGDLD